MAKRVVGKINREMNREINTNLNSRNNNTNNDKRQNMSSKHEENGKSFINDDDL